MAITSLVTAITSLSTYGKGITRQARAERYLHTVERARRSILRSPWPTAMLLNELLLGGLFTFAEVLQLLPVEKCSSAS